MYRFSYLGAISILLIPPAVDTESAAKDGGTLEYVFEAGEQNNRRDRRALNRYNAWAAIRKRVKILPNPFPSGADLLHDGADVAKNKKTQVPFSAFNSAKIASV
jgi:hypothetical protein